MTGQPTTGTDRYDTDPAAHAWARARIQHVIDGVTTTARTAENAGRHDRAAGLHVYADWLRRDFLDGTEADGHSVPPVFDPRPAQEPAQ